MCGIADGYEPAVRHATDRGVFQLGAVQQFVDPVKVGVEAPQPVQLPQASSVSGQRVGYDPAPRGQGVNDRSHPLPAALDAGNQDDRWSVSNV